MPNLDGTIAYTISSNLQDTGHNKESQCNELSYTCIQCCVCMIIDYNNIRNIDTYIQEVIICI